MQILIFICFFKGLDYHEVGRSMATLMSDEIFHEVAYKARNRNHLLAAIDEFLDAVTVLPPGEWDPSIRIEPPAAIPIVSLSYHILFIEFLNSRFHSSSIEKRY